MKKRLDFCLKICYNNYVIKKDIVYSSLLLITEITNYDSLVIEVMIN